VTGRSGPDLLRRDLIELIDVTVDSVPDFFGTVLGVRECAAAFNKNEARRSLKPPGFASVQLCVASSRAPCQVRIESA
jgi:hypothetical protein